PVGTDSIMLADFCRSINYKYFCDLGCGSGVISVILLSREVLSRGVGIEIQSSAYDIAVENTRINGLSDRLSLYNRDLRDCRDFLEPGAFDLVVSNPPYFPVGHGRSSPDRSAAISREEICCNLNELCTSASFLTKYGGCFALVYRTNRLSELLCALSSHGLEPKRLRFIHDRVTKAPELVLAESRRGGRPGLTVEAPLILYGEDGNMSAELVNLFSGNS
ncbi:MAG: methyltransferase, partial [Oscillospiraceae bacterium]|nr:methyltransferase [Oscillospiraceae bacterium]